MRFRLIVPLIFMAILIYSCKASKNQDTSPNNLTEVSERYNEERGRYEGHTIIGKVIDLKPSEDGAAYAIHLLSDGGDSLIIFALSEIIEGSDISQLKGKSVSVSYDEIVNHVAYDMRIANDEFEKSLHEVSINNRTGMGETYSIIGRYVYSEPRDEGTYLEIEGRYGTIYELSTEVTHSEWADQEVECAIYVVVKREAYQIQVKY